MHPRLDSGVALLQQGRPQDAWTVFRDILAEQPADAAAWHMMGLTLLQSGRRRDAIGHILQSITLDPHCAAAHCNLGRALRDDGALEQALESCNRALALDPSLVNAKINRANALTDLGRLDEALAVYDAVLDDPGMAGILPNRANVLRRLNRHREALRDFERAMTLFPDNAVIRAAAGYTHLALGEFDEGWPLSEWRWKNAATLERAGTRDFAQPRWTGAEALTGKTLLLHSEQGFGDTLQFCRYAAQASDRGARVILEVDEPLIGVMASLTGPELLITRGDPLPPFDLHCPLMSLPAAFRTRLETIPARVPYLTADRKVAAAWEQTLGPRMRRRAGLVWSGGHRPDQPELWAVNARRNLPLAKLAALKGVDADFYGLQKGAPAEDELRAAGQGGWDGPPITDLAPRIADFSDTAGIIDNLDLVVTVDTAVAHLAGALGKPVWILSRFDACWRWMQGRADSPWYPTARLFRQPAPGDWDSVMSDVRQALSGERIL